MHPVRQDRCASWPSRAVGRRKHIIHLHVQGQVVYDVRANRYCWARHALFRDSDEYGYLELRRTAPAGGDQGHPGQRRGPGYHRLLSFSLFVLFVFLFSSFSRYPLPVLCRRTRLQQHVKKRNDRAHGVVSESTGRSPYGRHAACTTYAVVRRQDPAVAIEVEMERQHPRGSKTQNAYGVSKSQERRQKKAEKSHHWPGRETTKGPEQQQKKTNRKYNEKEKKKKNTKQTTTRMSMQPSKRENIVSPPGIRSLDVP